MPNIGEVANSLSEWLRPLVRRAVATLLQTAVVLLIVALVIATASYAIAAPASRFRGVLACLATLVCVVGFGVPLMIKRVIGAVLHDGILQLGLGTKVSKLLFNRMGQVEPAPGQAAGSMPLAQAETLLQRATAAVVRVGGVERSRFLRGRLQAVIVGLVSKATRQRFRTVATRFGTVDVAKVQRQLSGDMDQQLVALVGKILRRTTAIALLACCGLPLLVALALRTI